MISDPAHPPISAIEDLLNTYIAESVVGGLVTLGIVLLAMRVFHVRAPRWRIRYYALVVVLPLIAGPIFYALVPGRRSLPVVPFDNLLDLDRLWHVLGPSHVWVQRFIVASSIGVGVTLAWRVARDLRAAGDLAPFRRLGLVRRDPELTRRVAELGCISCPPAPVYVLMTDRPVACCVGLRRCSLLISRGLLEALDQAALDHVLRHELAHCQRRDMRWGALMGLAARVAVFNPVVVFACRQILELQEQACDEEAVNGTGDRLGYARTLLRVCRLDAARNAGVGLGAFLGSGRGVEARVRRLLHPSPIAQVSDRRDAAVWAGTAMVSTGALFFVC